MDRTLDTSRLMKPVRFAHFVLRVTDLKASIDFYQRLLGMHVVHEASFIAFMTYDEEHHRIALVATPVTDPAPPGAAGLDHVAYTFASLEELLGNYLRLKSLGLVPVWSINHGPTTSLYYADPDGNRIELQVDNFDSDEKAQEYMQSDQFTQNPIGVEFDPDKLAARFEAGDPLEELKRQGATNA
jgi:catechol-2,3-dioxygenase